MSLKGSVPLIRVLVGGCRRGEYWLLRVSALMKKENSSNILAARKIPALQSPRSNLHILIHPQKASIHGLQMALRLRPFDGPGYEKCSSGRTWAIMAAV